MQREPTGLVANGFASDHNREVSATPILDLEQDPPKPPSPWRYRVWGVFLGLLPLSILILRDQGVLPAWRLPGCNGLLLIPALYIAIAFHEVGHLLVGLLVGLDSGGIAIGGFTFLKSGKNWVFRFDRRMWMGGFFKPLTRTAHFSLSRYAWMIAAGPLASICLSVVCYWIAVRHGSGRWDSIGSVFWCSLFISCVTVLPFSAGVNKSDGARLKMLIFHPEPAHF